MTNTIQTIINEIESLRGTTVRVFGQSTKIESKISALEIDIIDILENLKGYESEMIVESYDDELDEYDEYQKESIIEFLQYQEDVYGLKEVAHDNSYNWASHISNNFDFKVWSTGVKFYIEFKVHLYGDVRSNYSDTVLLEFEGNQHNDFYEFLELISDASRNEYIEVDGIEYAVYINPLTDTMEVEDNEYNRIGEIYSCDIEDAIKDIKKLIV